MVYSGHDFTGTRESYGVRVLIPGGAGYLGCQLVPRLLEAGWTVRVFDRGCFGFDGLRSCLQNPDLELVEGDIRRLQEHEQLLEGVDAIIHLAALVNDPSCDIDPEMAADINVESTLELARRAIQAGIRRLVFASTCAVYGRAAEWLARPVPIR